MWHGKNIHAHKMAYELFVEAVPEGLEVCHKCDVRDCVNPDHLFVATHLENVRDRNSKNRQAKGDKHGKHKVTEEQVREIRHALSQRPKDTPRDDYKAIAERYGISEGQVYMIVTKRQWRWLD